MTTALEVQGVSKAFGAIQVSNNIHLTLERGARHALIGPNGAGKTTLVSLLSGVLAPSAGRILLNGEDITGMPAWKRVKKGLVRTFQISSLFPDLTVLENVYMALNEHKRSSSRLLRPTSSYKQQIAQAEHILESFSMGADMHRAVSEVAYGRQRLTELAIAVALQPEVLLLDEPAAGIPSAEVELLLNAVKALPEHIAILIIEHDMQVVRQIATHATVLVQGEVLMSGSVDDVMNAPQVRDVYLGTSGVKRYNA